MSVMRGGCRAAAGYAYLMAMDVVPRAVDEGAGMTAREITRNTLRNTARAIATGSSHATDVQLLQAVALVSIAETLTAWFEREEEALGIKTGANKGCKR